MGRSVRGEGRSEGSSHVGLVLLQDHVAGELRLRDGGEPADDDQEGLQAGQTQLLAVVSGCHERHAHQVAQVENQEV